MQDIYVDDFGKGFPLVLVHGFLGSSKLWDPQINFLKNNFRIIAPDLPGFGKSNNVKSSDNINQMAETVLKKLNNPENQLENVINIIGSDGKNSVLTSLKYFLEANRQKVNAFTSPHLYNVQ